MTPEHPDYATMREEFLDLYARDLCRRHAPFPRHAELLEGLEARGLKWGIVTNKAERFAKPLIERTRGRPALRVRRRRRHDSAHQAHPEPLLEACAADRHRAGSACLRRRRPARRRSRARRRHDDDRSALRLSQRQRPDRVGRRRVVDSPEDVLEPYSWASAHRVGAWRNLSAVTVATFLLANRSGGRALWDNVTALEPNRGRPGFDVGYEAAQGMPRSSHLVKQLEHS